MILILPFIFCKFKLTLHYPQNEAVYNRHFHFEIFKLQALLFLSVINSLTTLRTDKVNKSTRWKDLLIWEIFFEIVCMIMYAWYFLHYFGFWNRAFRIFGVRSCWKSFKNLGSFIFRRGSRHGSTYEKVDGVKCPFLLWHLQNILRSPSLFLSVAYLASESN